MNKIKLTFAVAGLLAFLLGCNEKEVPKGQNPAQDTPAAAKEPEQAQQEIQEQQEQEQPPEIQQELQEQASRKPEPQTVQKPKTQESKNSAQAIQEQASSGAGNKVDKVTEAKDDLLQMANNPKQVQQVQNTQKLETKTDRLIESEGNELKSVVKEPTKVNRTNKFSSDIDKMFDDDDF